MRTIFILALLFTSFIANSQNTIMLFDNLVDKVWIAEGNWEDGTPFKQELTFTKDLNNKIVKVETKGFTNNKNSSWGKRSFGVRYWNEKENKLMFTEHDVFGNMTTGIVTSNPKGDIIYTYQYEGSTLTDYLKYLDNNTYELTIGILENNRFIQTFLKTKLTVMDNNRSFDFWIGKWTVYKYGTDTIAGYSHIESILDGQAIQETYTNANKTFKGTSLNKFNNVTQKWEQYWVDNTGTSLHLIGNLEAGKMILSSQHNNQDLIDKITWSAQNDKSVRQTWEQKQSKSAEWKVIFDGIYKQN